MNKKGKGRPSGYTVGDRVRLVKSPPRTTIEPGRVGTIRVIEDGMLGVEWDGWDEGYALHAPGEDQDSRSGLWVLPSRVKHYYPDQRKRPSGPGPRFDRDDLDTMAWAVECYIARAAGARHDPYPQAPRVLDKLRQARRELDEKYNRLDPAERVAAGFKSAGYALIYNGEEVCRGDLDECRAWIVRNTMYNYDQALRAGYELREIS